MLEELLSIFIVFDKVQSFRDNESTKRVSLSSKTSKTHLRINCGEAKDNDPFFSSRSLTVTPLPPSSSSHSPQAANSAMSVVVELQENNSP